MNYVPYKFSLCALITIDQLMEDTAEFGREIIQQQSGSLSAFT